MNQITEVIATIATAVIGLAILAVILSRNSNTAGVMGAAGEAFATVMNAATSPVTGVNMNGGSVGLGFGNQTNFAHPQFN